MKEKFTLVIILVAISIMSGTITYAGCLNIKSGSAGEKLTLHGIIDEASLPCGEDEVCLPCLTPVLKADDNIYYLNGIDNFDLEKMMSVSIEQIIRGDSVEIVGEVFHTDEFIYINAESITFIQEYFPQSTVWKYKEYSYYTDKTYFYQSYIDGDTIIDDVEYKILHSYELGSSMGNEMIINRLVPIRESKGKVYCRVKNIKDTGYEDVLLYDFNVSVGDIVKLRYYDSYPEEENIAAVTSIEEVILNDGTIAKKINYDKRNSDIEYVGSTSGFLYPLYGGLTPVGFHQSFLCCKHGDVTIYGEDINQAWTLPDKWVALDVTEYLHWQEEETKQISEHVYTIGRDTVITDNAYKTLWRDGKQYIGALRTEAEGQKVYYNPNGKEYLLMDFSLSEGDIVNAYWGDYKAEMECTEYWETEHCDTIMPEWKVTDVSIIDGRRHLNVERVDKYRPGIEEEWIEGVGTYSIVFPFASSPCREGDAGTLTLCAYSGEEQLYSFDLTKQGIVNECPEWHLAGQDLPETQRTDKARPKKQLHEGRLLIVLPDGRTYDALGRISVE